MKFRSLPALTSAFAFALLTQPGCDCGTAPVSPCADLSCGDGEVCDETGEAAVCRPTCDDDEEWDGSACVPIAEELDCDLCAADHRECTSVACGDCLVDFVEDASESCVPVATCEPAPAVGSVLSECEDDNRVCVEGTPGLAVCGGCAEGLVPEDPLAPDDGACRDPILCADLGCGADQFCIASPGVDAYCSDTCVTSDGEPGTEFPGGLCAPCPACDGEGEDGPWLEALTGADRCICETLAGFYWEEGSSTTKRCDKDGDGFVNVSAQPALNAAVGSAVRTNARCTVRQVDRVIVENDVGEERVVELNSRISLFESERNDDQDAMDRATVSASVPELPMIGARYLTAAELNAFTRACGGATADFNDNGLSDLDEYQERDALDIPASRAALRPFLPFSYFLELYRGVWVAPATGESYGHFRIVERSRAEAAERGVPFVYPETTTLGKDPNGGTTVVDADYWRSCPRLEDPRYAIDGAAGGTPTGHDFARLNDASWSGANHHSQFKCVQAVQQLQLGDPPHKVALSDVNGASPKLRLNDCAAGGVLAPLAADDATNPSEPVLSCSLSSSIANGDVRFGVVPYRPYADPSTAGAASEYQGGCVNECAEYGDTCPGYDPDQPGRTQCLGDAANYGRLFCGCGPYHAGADCELACGGIDRRTSEEWAFGTPYIDGDFRLAPRLGYWMCGTVVSSGGTLSDDTGTYTLVGGVPARAEAVGERASAEGGWVLR